MIIRLETKKQSTSINLSSPPTIVFERPGVETETRTFYTYFREDDSEYKRCWPYLVPHKRSKITTRMANIVARNDLNLVKKLHRYSHANAQEMELLLKDAGIFFAPVRESMQKCCSLMRRMRRFWSSTDKKKNIHKPQKTKHSIRNYQ